MEIEIYCLSVCDVFGCFICAECVWWNGQATTVNGPYHNIFWFECIAMPRIWRTSHTKYENRLRKEEKNRNDVQCSVCSNRCEFQSEICCVDGKNNLFALPCFGLELFLTHRAEVRWPFCTPSIPSLAPSHRFLHSMHRYLAISGWYYVQSNVNFDWYSSMVQRCHTVNRHNWAEPSQAEPSQVKCNIKCVLMYIGEVPHHI